MDFSHPEWQVQCNPPEDVVTTPLKYHQRLALSWMQHREDHVSMGVRGGIFGDEPGLGKTLTCLSLISTRPTESATLVVLPANLISNWKNEIRTHTMISDKHVFSYYGKDRAAKLAKVSGDRNIKIILTSYQTLARDDPETSILNFSFGRVILDEAHCIKNPASIIFKTVAQIRADIRWVITATPLMNALTEVFAYTEFLKADILKRKYNMKNEEDVMQLQKDIFSICLIRLKKNVLRLPEKKYLDRMIELPSIEAEFYIALKKYSESRIKKMMRKYEQTAGSDIYGRRLKAMLMNSIFVLILRLRQACNSPQLVIPKIRRLVGHDIYTSVRLLNHYSEEDYTKNECPLCLEFDADTTSDCGHSMCEECWKNWEVFCPICRAPVSTLCKNTSCATVPAVTRGATIGIDRSEKAEQFFKYDLPFVLERGEGAIVSSQHLSYLKYLADRFSSEYPDLEYVFIDGSVPPMNRNEILNNFRNNPNCRICFISFMSSPEGMNIVEASWVFLFEKYWNSKKELQLIDRTHRIGQTKKVTVVNYIAKNTIEERVIELVGFKDDQIDVFMANKKATKSENWLLRTVKLLE